MSAFPERGRDRGDRAPGVRMLTLKRRVLVAYRADGNGVEILRLMYAGRDYAADDLTLTAVRGRARPRVMRYHPSDVAGAAMGNIGQDKAWDRRATRW